MKRREDGRRIPRPIPSLRAGVRVAERERKGGKRAGRRRMKDMQERANKQTPWITHTRERREARGGFSKHIGEGSVIIRRKRKLKVKPSIPHELYLFSTAVVTVMCVCVCVCVCVYHSKDVCARLLYVCVKRF